MPRASTKSPPRRSRANPAGLPVVSPTQRAQHENWLQAITAIPTAAGREHRVIEWIEAWAKQRADVRLSRDRAGNLRVTKRARPAGSSQRPPLLITAHLDHPAFVVTGVRDSRTIDLEFRGGVSDPYFAAAAIEVCTGQDTHIARVVAIDSTAKPFKRITAKLEQPGNAIAAGDIARWRFEDEAGALPRIEDGMLRTHACDDLAAVAAAISAFEIIRSIKGCGHVGLMFTRAEEVGFIGAIAACQGQSVPRKSRLICLENSRSFPHDSPIGAGPIVRVGDRMSVFEPALTNAISMLMTEHQKANPHFKFQRKLMPGGTCEATTFSAYGYQSTCLCLPLGNYHNMADIDEVAAGKRPARVGPEFISIDDYHGLIEMLLVCAIGLSSEAGGGLVSRMESLMAQYGFVLE